MFKSVRLSKLPTFVILSATFFRPALSSPGQSVRHFNRFTVHTTTPSNPSFSLAHVHRSSPRPTPKHPSSFFLDHALLDSLFFLPPNYSSSPNYRTDTYVGEAVGRRGVPCIASSSPPPRPSRDQMTKAPPQWQVATRSSLYTRLRVRTDAPSGALRWYSGPHPPAALLPALPLPLPLPLPLLSLRQPLRPPLLFAPPPPKLLIRHPSNPLRHLLAAGRLIR